MSQQSGIPQGLLETLQGQGPHRILTPVLLPSKYPKDSPLWQFPRKEVPNPCTANQILPSYPCVDGEIKAPRSHKGEGDGWAEEEGWRESTVGGGHLHVSQAGATSVLRLSPVGNLQNPRVSVSCAM